MFRKINEWLKEKVRNWLNVEEIPKTEPLTEEEIKLFEKSGMTLVDSFEELINL